MKHKTPEWYKNRNKYWDSISGCVNSYITVANKPDKKGVYKEYIDWDNFNDMKTALSEKMKRAVDYNTNVVIKILILGIISIISMIVITLFKIF